MSEKVSSPAQQFPLSTDKFDTDNSSINEAFPESEPLTLDRLAAGDRPSIVAIGMVAAQALKKAGTAIFMVDVLGRVRLMPPQSINARPKVSSEELHTLSEDDAIRVMLAQGDSEDDISDYLALRDALSNEKDIT